MLEAQNIEEVILSFKEKLSYVDDEATYKVLEGCQIKELEAGEELVRFNQWTGNVVYVLNGLLEMYYVDSKGEQVIIEFIQEGQITGNWQRTLAEEYSQIIIRAIEPLTYIEMMVEYIDQLVEENHLIARAYNQLIREMYANALNNNLFQMQLKPKDRYIWMLENQTVLLKRITQKQLAAYLGITPVSLSRIKKRIQEK